MNDGEPGRQWERWMRFVSVATSSVVIPGIAWAFATSRDLHELRVRVDMMSTQMDIDRRGIATICDELKGLRGSVDALRADMLQRMTRVETRLEDQAKTPR